MRPQAEDEDGRAPAEIAGEWCVRLAAGPLTYEQQIEFDAWIGDDPAHADALDRALTVWSGLHAISDQPEIIAKRADALDALRRANRRRWSRFGNHWRGVGIAASLMLVVVAALWMIGDRTTLYATGLGERRAVLLADGSRISLDAETRVEVDLKPEQRALRLLAGRAKFDVAKDPDRPFTVTAANRTVIATGTAFSVELLGSQVHVILYEGKVAVVKGEPPPADQLRAIRERPGPAATGLTPGRELVANVQGPVAERILENDVGRSLAWEGGQLNFVDEPLSAAVERLNRYSATKLSIGDARAANIKINGVFNAGDSPAFVDALSEAYGVRVQRRDSEILIGSAGS